MAMHHTMATTMAHNENMNGRHTQTSAMTDDAMESKQMAPSSGGHNMSPDDPDNPQNWPVLKKVFVSLVSSAFTWVV